MSDLTTGGYLGSAREVLGCARAERQWDRLAYCTSVLSALVARRGLRVARQWVEDEPSDPDAALLHARVLVADAVRAARSESPGARSAAGNAAFACRVAVQLAPEDPTPWVALLRLGQVPFDLPDLHLSTQAPDGLAVRGPWTLMNKIIERDPYNREAFHRLVSCCFAPSATTVWTASTAAHDPEPFDDARARALIAVWAADRAPAGSPLKLLRLMHAPERNPYPQVSESVRFQNSGTYGQSEAEYFKRRYEAVAERWRLSLREGAIHLAERWFADGAEPPYMPLSDVSFLASCLYARHEYPSARLCLEWMLPHASTEPWSRDGEPGEVLTKVCVDCGVPYYLLPN